MDIFRLYEFIALSQTLNFSRAAQQLFITQPVLSRHITDLERNLGMTLFTRNTHQVRLTGAGRIFISDTKRIIEKYESALGRLRAVGLPENGKVVVGFLHSAFRDLLVDFTQMFSARYPEIELDFQAIDLDDFIRAFSNNKIDLGFSLHIDGGVPEGISEKVIYRDRECAIVPKSHRLAFRKEIDIRELEGESFIFISPISEQSINQHHRSMLDKCLKNYTVSKEAMNVESALFFVELNKGITFLPRHRVTITGRNTVAIDIENPECLLEIGMWWKESNNNPAAKLFIEEFECFSKKI